MKSVVSIFQLEVSIAETWMGYVGMVEELEQEERSVRALYGGKKVMPEPMGMRAKLS
jgi:hypothetical protein